MGAAVKGQNGRTPGKEKRNALCSLFFGKVSATTVAATTTTWVYSNNIIPLF